MEQMNALKESTARLSVMSNTMLVVLKLIVGFSGGAVSIISEAAHSGVDLIAALIAFFAVRKAAKPPDAQHAYGHGKIEDLSAAVEALLIVAAALWIIYESAKKLSSPHTPELLEYGVAIMLISIGLNWWVSSRLLKVARSTGSHALEADALHLQADIWTSAGVLVGLVIIKITGLVWLDPLIAIGVALFVFKAGYEMTKKSFAELTDSSLPSEEEAAICRILDSHPSIIAYHRLRTRRSGSHRLIDVHLILYKEMPLDQAHQVSDEIEAEIETIMAPCDVVIHLEPCGYHGEMGECPLNQENKN